MWELPGARNRSDRAGNLVPAKARPHYYAEHTVKEGDGAPGMKPPTSRPPAKPTFSPTDRREYARGLCGYCCFERFWRKEEGKIDGNASAPGPGGRCSPCCSPSYSLSPPEAPRSPRCAIYGRGSFGLLLLFTMVAVDPELARERARPAGRDVDPGSRTAKRVLFLVTVIFAALDIGRLHQSDSVPPLVAACRGHWCLRQR